MLQCLYTLQVKHIVRGTHKLIIKNNNKVLLKSLFRFDEKMQYFFQSNTLDKKIYNCTLWYALYSINGLTVNTNR